MDVVVLTSVSLREISRFGVMQFSGFGCILFIGFLTEGMWKFGFLRHSPVDLKYLI